MYCPRLDHFVRFNANGTIGKCGHMVDAPGFDSWQQMQISPWLKSIQHAMDLEQWPQECQRCQHIEDIGGESIRMASVKRHEILKRIIPDYVILGGILDNVCNSACQSCNAELSTKIGSLQGSSYVKTNNTLLLEHVPLDKVVEVDINGGEPSASPNYQRLLENLPPMTRILRVNTNMSRIMPNIENILDRGIFVIITMSMDGVGKVHDYVRWPIQWSQYLDNLERYKTLAQKHKNLHLQAWTVVHALNLGDLANIMLFCNQNQIKHNWAWLTTPDVLDPAYSNDYTNSARQILMTSDNAILRDACEYVAKKSNNQHAIQSFIAQQDTLRKINIKNYL